MFEIWKYDTLRPYVMKRYPFKIQAYIWCILNGYVSDCGRFGFILDNERIKIKEVENEQ